jgi:hypothetical protein
MLSAGFASAQSPEIPIIPDLKIVLAVANGTSSENGPAGILQGDYEMVVVITDVTADWITHSTSFDGVDARGVQRKGRHRVVRHRTGDRTGAVWASTGHRRG